MPCWKGREECVRECVWSCLPCRFECCAAATCDVQEHLLIFLFLSLALEVANGCYSALLAAGTRDAVVLLVPSRFNPKSVQREGCRRRSRRCLSCVSVVFCCLPSIQAATFDFYHFDSINVFWGSVWFSDVRVYLSRREICFGREAETSKLIRGIFSFLFVDWMKTKRNRTYCNLKNEYNSWSFRKNISLIIIFLFFPSIFETTFLLFGR